VAQNILELNFMLFVIRIERDSQSEEDNKNSSLHNLPSDLTRSRNTLLWKLEKARGITSLTQIKNVIFISFISKI
jgi:hypothetical protein